MDIRHINEADKKEFSSKKEQFLKKQIIALLKDDGDGHHFPKYAEKLADFDIRIVYDDGLCPTAQVNFETGIIEINHGFLEVPPPKKGEKFPKLFKQISVLIRHEMAHNLLMHNVRMTKKLIKDHGDVCGKKFTFSRSLHDLLNIIADFEISNRVYSETDKNTVKNMFLSGNVIGGLVTEDHREEWMNLSVVDMYTNLSKDINKLQNDIRELLNYGYDLGASMQNAVGNDWLKTEIARKLLYYIKVDAPSNFIGQKADNDIIDDYINIKALYHFVPFDEGNSYAIIRYDNLPDEYQAIIKDIHDNFIKSPKVTAAMIETILKDLSQTSLQKEFDIVDPTTGEVYTTVYTPEEKCLAMDVLKETKYIKNLYQEWYKKAIEALTSGGNYTQQDFEKIYAALNK